MLIYPLEPLKVYDIMTHLHCVKSGTTISNKKQTHNNLGYNPMHMSSWIAASVDSNMRWPWKP